ncbi:ribonuclease [Aureococcus anophagefferens]|nr:ribonuclease [Aureococcus anophagefferens]
MDKGWEEVPHRDDVGVVLWDEAADLPRVRAVRRTRVNNAGGWVKLRDVEALPSAVASASRREARVAEERDETAHPYAAFCDKTTRPTASDLKRCFPAGTAASDALVRWTCEARDNVLVRQIQDDRCRTFDGRGGGACPACAYGPVCKSNLHPDFNVRRREAAAHRRHEARRADGHPRPRVRRLRDEPREALAPREPVAVLRGPGLGGTSSSSSWTAAASRRPSSRSPSRRRPRDAADADFLSRVEKPEDDDRIRYVHREAARLSVGDERNELLKHASGEFVAHFDDACVYAPGYVSAMVSHLKASDAQLVRLEAAVGWDPVSNAVRLHKALGFRPETFVHRKAPLRALAFDDADVGEDAGFTSLAVCHVLDDSAGMLFAHAKHSKKPAALLRAHDAQWRDAAPTFLDAVAPPLRRLLAAHRRFFTNWKFLHHASTKRAAPSPFSNAPAGAGKGCDIPNFKGSYLGRFPLVPAGATFVSAPVESTGVSLEDDEPPPEPPARPAQPMDPIERARLRAARRLARKNATSEDEELAVLRRAAPPMPPVALEYGEADDDDDGFRIVEMASE